MNSDKLKQQLIQNQKEIKQQNKRIAKLEEQQHHHNGPTREFWFFVGLGIAMLCVLSGVGLMAFGVSH